MPDWVLGNLRGMEYDSAPAALPDSLATDMTGVLLVEGTIGQRRPSLAAVALTSGPSGAPIDQLIRHYATDATTNSDLFAFYGTSCSKWTGGTWSAVSLADTSVSAATARPYGATFNGMLYLAYDSSVNRLHLWDGSAVRRVGIEASAAATVANTGAGAYAATIRYYKIQWKIVSGSDTLATSELSASVSFTPSGGGTAARVTKPTTPDSATHWIVFGSADNLNYYNISGNVAVGTTTYDDSATPSAYSVGDIAPSAGLYVPPPSCKYLLSTDNRLFMAGAWETTASSTQTGVKTSRVWFTQVNGALDETGEAEAIAQSTTTKDWIDVGENDGDAITGLSLGANGSVYVFKRRSVWRLTPTGIPDTPYRGDRITDVTGASWQDGIVRGEDGQGDPMVYFVGSGGKVYSLSMDGRVTYLSAPWRGWNGVARDLPIDAMMLEWDRVRGVLWCMSYDQANGEAFAYQPMFAFTDHLGRARGGWTYHQFALGGTGYRLRALRSFDATLHTFALYIAGRTDNSTTPGLASLTGVLATDMDSNGQAITMSVRKVFLPAGGVGRRVNARAPFLEVDSTIADGTITVDYKNFSDGPTTIGYTGVSDTLTTRTANPYNLIIRETAEGAQLSDLDALEVRVSLSGAPGVLRQPRFVRLVVPHAISEPV